MKLKRMKVLIISKLFPPEKGARALQISKVVEAIKDKGCEPFVLAGYAKDKRKNVTIDKSISLFPIHYISYTASNTGKAFLNRAFNRLKSEIISVNIKSKWIKNTYFEALEVINFFKPEILFTSSYPFDSHLVGLLIKRKTQIPWISSFSDPWPSYIQPCPYNVYDLPILRIFQMAYLKEILKNSDAIHMTNNIVSELVQNKCQLFVPEKFFIIPHIRSEIVIKEKRIKKGTIAYVGNLTRERLSAPVFNALKYLALKYKDRMECLLIVGYVCKEFEKFKKKLKIGFFIEETGYKPNEEAMRIAASSEILLLIEANMDYSPFLPSKFADYVSTGRPIIAVTPKISTVREYIEQYGGGYAVSHNEREIIGAIIKIFNRKSNDDLKKKEGQLESIAKIFKAEAVARLYVQMFKQVKRNNSHGQILAKEKLY